MSINYAILGMLSYKSMTGYDLKKIIQDSDFMPWSGNNNQIYKSLTELLDKGLVTNVVKHQESLPTKKIYTVTSEGLSALKEWVLSPSELSEMKKPFLIQLACSKQLNTNELKTLIDGYESQVKLQLVMAQNNRQDTDFLSGGPVLEKTIWNFISNNIRRTYENELEWIQDLRRAIVNTPNENDKNEKINMKETFKEEKSDGIMKYKFIRNNGLNYVHFNDSNTKLETERNILEVITALAENNTQFVLFDSETLSKDFLWLKKGLVGTMLQKFTMYHINSAIIIKDKDSLKGEFRDSIAESGKHGVLKLFTSIADAEKWFMGLKQKGEF
jgi:DNA-binding PadR family transcriptional regulator